MLMTTTSPEPVFTTAVFTNPSSAPEFPGTVSTIFE